MNIQKIVEVVVIFSILLAAFFLTNPMENKTEVIPTSTPAPTFTIIPTDTPFILPTMTVAPVVIIVTEVVRPVGDFDQSFYNAIVCQNVPIFSQPESNFNLIIGKFYKGNVVQITGQTQFWAKVSVPSTGQVGYVPREYVAC